jgi:hypothetical protein
MSNKITQEHNYETVASIVLTQYTTYKILDIVTANGFVTANVAYELTTALKERFQFVCIDILHRNFTRDLRTAVHSHATFVSFGFCCTIDICRVCMTFRERNFPPPPPQK